MFVVAPEVSLLIGDGWPRGVVVSEFIAKVAMFLLNKHIPDEAWQGLHYFTSTLSSSQVSSPGCQTNF